MLYSLYGLVGGFMFHCTIVKTGASDSGSFALSSQ